MGAPTWPPNPPTLVAPRRSRRAPHYPAPPWGAPSWPPIAMGWRPPRRMKWGKVGPWSPGLRRGGNGTASPSPIWHGSYRHPALLPQSTPSKLGRTKLLRALTTSLARRRAMERVIERGAGLDVHKKSVTACVRVPGPEGCCRAASCHRCRFESWLRRRTITAVISEQYPRGGRDAAYARESRRVPATTGRAERGWFGGAVSGPSNVVDA